MIGRSVDGSVWLRRAVIAAGILAVALGAITPGAAQSKLPARLDSFIKKYVKLTPAQESGLMSGQPVTALLATDPSKEVAVFGAVWVAAPAARYVAAVKDIEQFEKGGSFAITKKISTPPRLEDFAKMHVPDDDFADLRACKVGACELKIGERMIERARKEIDWSKPSAHADLDRLVQSLAFDYVKGYLEGGNARLAVYRDADRPTYVSQEFTSMIDRLPELNEYLPGLKGYLLDYPKATLPNSESFIYWQEAAFGLKPTIRITHLVISQAPGGVTVASKMLYATHYFWTALDIRALIPDPSRGEGFWLATVGRSRSDGLSGFVGSLIRGKVRREAEAGTLAALKVTKTNLEGGKR